MSLSELWAKTNGIYIESPILYLRVRSEEQPVSYVPNQVWLASYERLKEENEWRVGIWGNFLKMASPQDAEAVASIWKEIGLVDQDSLKAGNWIPVPVLPRGEQQASL